MKKVVCLLLATLLLVFCGTLLASCSGIDDNGRTITLYVYNWGEYISDGYEDTLDVNKAFEEYCREELGMNVRVNYSTFSSNEDMYAKVSSGAALYDVVIPSDYMIERMIGEGLLQPLNTDNIPNLVYIKDDYKGEKVYYEPQDGNTYSVPYFYGKVGIIYNTDMVPEETAALQNESWDLMWDETFKGEILQFNNSRDAFGTALYKLGYSVNDTETKGNWQEALELLKEQKKLVQSYVMDEVFYKMKSGSAAIAAYYAGDFFSMYEDNDKLDFFYPKEGTNFYFDAMCIPSNAQHKELAEAYINFMCRPDIACANAGYTYYASPLDFDYIEAEGNEDYVAAMEEYFDTLADIREDAYDILYGETTEEKEPEPYMNLSAEGLVMLNDMWEELKVESSIGKGIYITIGVILTALIALAIFYFVRRHRWSKLYD